MKTSDTLIVVAVIIWLWLTRERDAELPPKPKSEMDRFKSNLEAQWETPWEIATTAALKN